MSSAAIVESVTNPVYRAVIGCRAGTRKGRVTRRALPGNCGSRSRWFRRAANSAAPVSISKLALFEATPFGVHPRALQVEAVRVVRELHGHGGVPSMVRICPPRKMPPETVSCTLFPNPTGGWPASRAPPVRRRVYLDCAGERTVRRGNFDPGEGAGVRVGGTLISAVAGDRRVGHEELCGACGDSAAALFASHPRRRNRDQRPWRPHRRPGSALLPGSARVRTRSRVR